MLEEETFHKKSPKEHNNEMKTSILTEFKNKVDKMSYNLPLDNVNDSMSTYIDERTKLSKKKQIIKDLKTHLMTFKNTRNQYFTLKTKKNEELKKNGIQPKKTDNLKAFESDFENTVNSKIEMITNFLNSDKSKSKVEEILYRKFGGKRRTKRRSNKKRTNKRKTRMKKRKTLKRKTNKRRRKR